ncbi:2028_t:CDS:2, partial [Funneliformis caledonium]
KKHNLRKNIRLKGIIKNIVPNRGFPNDPSQDILVNPLNDPIEVDTLSNNSNQTIKPIQPVENYSFLPKKLSKGESKEKQKGLYYTSNRKIELELLKTIQYNSLLDQFFSYTQDYQYLSACLPLIMPKETTGSLTIQDELNGIDYREFINV